MIIVMAPNSTQAELDNVISKVKSQGLDVHLSQGTSRTIVGVIDAVCQRVESSVRI